MLTMDIDMPASIDVNKSHGLCTLESTNAATEDHSVNKLGNDVIESLNIDKYEVPGSKPPFDDYNFQKKDKAIDSSCSCSSSPLSPTVKPVSAMKGSREGPPQKRTVKWAPEVYDPVPTSVSHAVTNNKPQKSKKKSKSKQKNGSKSSRGNKHKDKLAGKGGGV
ncbi:uncharacterized protein LOC143622791 [Bidens hawaiensis]|uniref:uncharacterized protein LOC143622791 n=1 Tax=Bidens hawaiensis TaxID=980011 RepID=UPI00404B6BEC